MRRSYLLSQPSIAEPAYPSLHEHAEAPDAGSIVSLALSPHTGITGRGVVGASVFSGTDPGVVVTSINWYSGRAVTGTGSLKIIAGDKSK